MAQQEELRIKAILDTQEFDTSLESMKQEFAALEKKLGSSLLSPQDQKAVIQRMGTLKKEIDGLNRQIDTIARQSGFEQLTQAVTPLVGAFTAAGSALQIFGVENEKLNEIIQQTQSLTIGLIAVRDLANLKELKSLALLKAERIKNLIVDKLTFKQTVQQTVANTAEATSKGLVTAATSLATKAQIAWNAAVAANPIGLILTAIAALVTGIILLVRWLGDSTDAFEQQKEAIDGTKFSNDELLESYNESIKGLRDLELEYKVATGQISEFEKSLKSLEYALDDQINEITNKYIPQINELNEKYASFWRKTWVALKSIIIGTQNEIVNESIRYAEEQGEILNNKNREIIDAITKSEREKFKIIFKNQEDINKKVKDLQNKKAEIIRKGEEDSLKVIITALDKKLSEYEKYIDDIESIIKDAGSTVEDLQIEIDLRAGRITETEAELRRLEQSIKQTGEEAGETGRKFGELFRDAGNGLRDFTDAIQNTEQQLQSLGDNTKLQKEIDTLNQRAEILDKQIKQSELAVKTQEEYILQLGRENFLVREVERIEKDKENRQVNLVKLQNKLIQEKGVEVEATSLLSSLYAEQLDRQNSLADVNQKLLEYENEKARRATLQNELTTQLQDLKRRQEVIDAQLAGYSEEQLKDLEERFKLEDELLRVKIEQLKKQQEINDELSRTELAAQLADLEAERQRRQTDTFKLGIEDAKKLEEERLKVQISAVDEYYAYRIEQAKDPLEVQILTEQWVAELDNLRDAFKERWDALKNLVRDGVLDIANQIGTGVIDIFQQSVFNQFELLNRQLQESVTSAQESLDRLRDENLISEEEYEQRSLTIQENAAAEEKRLKLEQAKAEKRLAIFQILIDTSVAVAKALAQGGGLFGPGLAGIVAAQGALQLALVSAQPLPEYKKGGKVFERGGKLGGKSHELGGTVIEAEAGEYIINKNVVQQPGVENLLNLINGSNNQQQPVPTTTNTTDDNIIRKIVQETVNGISSIPVTNLESEYTKVQRKVKSIETRSRW